MKFDASLCRILVSNVRDGAAFYSQWILNGYAASSLCESINLKIVLVVILFMHARECASVRVCARAHYGFIVVSFKRIGIMSAPFCSGCPEEFVKMYLATDISLILTFVIICHEYFIWCQNINIKTKNFSFLSGVIVVHLRDVDGFVFSLVLIIVL